MNYLLQMRTDAGAVGRVCLRNDSFWERRTPSMDTTLGTSLNDRNMNCSPFGNFIFIFSFLLNDCFHKRKAVDISSSTFPSCLIQFLAVDKSRLSEPLSLICDALDQGFGYLENVSLQYVGGNLSVTWNTYHISSVFLK